MIDTLKSLNDPRLEFYAEPAAEDGEYRGLGNGIETPPLSLAWYSRIGNFWRADGAATPTAIMTYSEVLFLEAEAARRGWIAGDPAALYEAGIRANMNQYDAWSPANAPTHAEIDAYLAQSGSVQCGDRDEADPAAGVDRPVHERQRGVGQLAPDRRAPPDAGAGSGAQPDPRPFPVSGPRAVAQQVQPGCGGVTSGRWSGLVTPVWWDELRRPARSAGSIAPPEDSPGGRFFGVSDRGPFRPNQPDS